MVVLVTKTLPKIVVLAPMISSRSAQVIWKCCPIDTFSQILIRPGRMGFHAAARENADFAGYSDAVSVQNKKRRSHIR